MRRATLLLALALGMPAATAQVLVDPRLEFEPVVTGLSLPTGMVFLGDAEFLVVQKNDGLVRHVVNDMLQAGEVLDVHVNFRLERGLLGIVTDPDLLHNGFVYLYYTESSTGADTDVIEDSLGNRVYRYTWNGTDLVDPRLVLDLPDSTEFPGIIPGAHNGGVMAFGPDDRLYVLIGDQGRGSNLVWCGQLQNNADGPTPNDNGVIFRVNGAGHGLPDNPFYNSLDAADPMNRYFAYGVRNSFGIVFDPIGGDLWHTENGPTDLDEINRIFSGFNGGWIRIKGPISEDVEGEADLWVVPGSAYGDPQFSWRAPVAPTAIAFAKSPKLGCDLQNDMIVGDFNCRQLYHFELDATRQSLAFASPELQDLVADNTPDACVDEVGEIVFGPGPDFGLITDLENGPDGRLYVVQYSPGGVGRIAPVEGAVPDADGDEVDDSCDCDPADPSAFGAPVEVPRLRLAGGPATTLGWDSQQVTAGPGTSYTVVSGSVADLRLDGGFQSACVVGTGLASPELNDARTPSPNEALYYVVRAGNNCAIATYGDSSFVRDPRDMLDVAAPPACAAGASFPSFP